MPRIDYFKEDIEALLPAVWNSTRVLEAVDPHAPDPEMPKSQSDPRRASDKVARCADIQRAWQRANLSRNHRAACLIICGVGGSVHDVAAILDIEYAQASLIYSTALEELGFVLNGVTYKQAIESRSN